MKTDNYKRELQIAKDVVLKAGTILTVSRERNKIIKQPHGDGYLDVTTSVDIESESLLIETIASEFPQDSILSEETRVEYTPDKKRLWIMDPLDGTTNYVKGLDAYAVSVALMDEGKAVMAVNYIPTTGDMYHAVRGQGVFLNDKKLVIVNPDETLGQSLVSVGFPHSRTKDVADRAFALYRDIWLASSDLRRSASAVVDGCLLASGITGAYLTPDIKPWDIVSGSLFVEEQGGIASDLHGQPLDLFRRSGNRFSTSVIFAKNKTIHDAVKEITMRYN